MSWLLRGSLLDGERDRVAAAETQGGETLLLAAILQRIEQRGQDARSGGADRMPEGDRAAVHVHRGRIEAALAHDGDCLRRERLVHLDQVEALRRGAELLV